MSFFDCLLIEAEGKDPDVWFATLYKIIAMKQLKRYIMEKVLSLNSMGNKLFCLFNYGICKESSH